MLSISHTRSVLLAATSKSEGQILLLFPRVVPYPENGVPLAALALAATLDRAGFRPIIIDQSTDPSWRDTLSRHVPGALWAGVSALTGDQLRHGLEMAAAVRALAPPLPIVWGGHHPTADPLGTAADTLADVVVRGEGDQVAVELSRALAAGRPLSGVPGLTFQHEGQMVSTPDQPLVDIESLPDPPWHLFDLGRYYSGRRWRTLIVQSGRGCAHRCTFCSLGGAPRPLSGPRILDVVEPVIREHRVNELRLAEPLFVSSERRVAAFCEEKLRRGLDCLWTGAARASTFRRFPRELIALMKRSGCRMLRFGFESGSPRTLARLNKRITVEDIRASVEICARSGIVPRAFFLIGVPGESFDELLQTLRLVAWVRRTCPRLWLHVGPYVPFPGTPLHEECVRRFGLSPPRTLREWADFRSWKDRRPWIGPGSNAALRLLNGSVYASDLQVLREDMPNLRLLRPLHALTSAAYLALSWLDGGGRC